MDENHKHVLTVAAWVVASPFILLIGVPILLCVVFAVYNAIQSANFRRQQFDLQQKATVTRKAAEEHAAKERAQHLDALKAALPSTPPERMRATIHVNEVTAMVLVRQGLGGKKIEEIPTSRYAVDMILELSERDRAVVREEQLDRIVIEKAPKYGSAEILNMLGEFDKTRNSLNIRKTKDAVARIVMDEQRPTYESYAGQTTEITIGNYLTAPYTRIFDTKHEANAYSDRLKTDLLPKVRELLDQNVDRSTSQTVEF